jgi:FMN hydrolase / 5-amino-6-(5-phospho-D-ribitylamino)uracil phosphatase
MPGHTVVLRVSGTASREKADTMLVLDGRLEGYDSYLTGKLQLVGQEPVTVRVLTLDDVTVLRCSAMSTPPEPGERWTGTLRLRPGFRSRAVPEDLASAAATRHRDLFALDSAELRYALTFLEESTTASIRQQRIAAIVDALPASARPGGQSTLLISLDVGGTLGRSAGIGAASALASASPLPDAEARRVMRRLLHTAPEISEGLAEDLCQALQIPWSAFPSKLGASPFEAFTGAVEAVRELSTYGTVITLSNVICAEADTDALWHLFFPWLTDQFPSCQTGFAKPDIRAFATAARTCDIDISNMIHIGDSWECDIVGATEAGAMAIWVSGGRPVPEPKLAARRNVQIVHDIRQVPAHVPVLARG